MFIEKLRYFWMILLVIFTSFSIFIIYSRYHQLLPNAFHFQVLNSNHPFELYHMKFSQLFSFEKINLSQFYRSLPLRIIWGVQPIDDGNYLDPYDRGKLTFDDNFDASSKESQQFLYDLCNDIRKQPFFKPTLGLHLSNCFIETFKLWMNRLCHDSILKENYYPCCRNSSFPFEPDVFDECLPIAIDELLKQRMVVSDASLPGPRFSVADGKIKAVAIEFETVFNFSLSFKEMDDFVNTIDSWLELKLDSAPPSMKNGWFVSDLAFYELQNSLLFGAFVAVGVASLVSFLLVVAVTLNIRLSVIAVMNMMAVILFVLVSFILIGWSLNVFQSIIISLLIGLSVDFIMHYTFAYKLSPIKNNRQAMIKCSISCICSPVSMSFVSTFTAGFFMMFSSVLIYVQIGIFLMLLSFISWFTSTFILQSFLLTFGPTTT